jgi:N-acetylglucosamine-6-phosphate deacetylase
VRLGVEAAVVDGQLVPGDVEVDDGRIAAVGLAGPGRGVAVPGFVDLQVNGFAGVDFMHADAVAYRRAGEAMLETGVTAFQPTLITASEEDLLAAIEEVPDDGSMLPRILGVHLEGPFLSPRRLGVHPAAFRRDPDLALAQRLLDAGRVGYMTVAPELPGALELADLLHSRGVVVSIGHSDATAPEAEAAFDRGVRTVTHLFNAMRPFHHRDPGIVGAALARPDVVVQLILDGNHVAPETARLVWAAASGRVALVTDAMAAAGAGDGAFPLGNVEVSVNGGVARSSDGALAGSSMTMVQALRNLCALGLPLAEAVGAVTSVPARAAGREDVGSIRPGARADIVVLDDGLQIRSVIAAGSARVAA